jgi:4,5-DOPA dioxygenase extradiol
VLVHAFPDASIPVAQLSINADKPLEYHLELGAKLAPLRERGVLILASGNVVHNLRAMDWKLDTGFDWAHRFDDAAKERVLSQPSEATSLSRHADFAIAVPTPDHFIPWLYLAGLASVGADDVDVLVDGYSYGSLSMTAYTLGAPAVTGSEDVAAQQLPPHAPADASNI